MRFTLIIPMNKNNEVGYTRGLYGGFIRKSTATFYRFLIISDNWRRNALKLLNAGLIYNYFIVSCDTNFVNIFDVVVTNCIFLLVRQQINAALICIFKVYLRLMCVFASILKKNIFWARFSSYLICCLV